MAKELKPLGPTRLEHSLAYGTPIHRLRLAAIVVCIVANIDGNLPRSRYRTDSLAAFANPPIINGWRVEDIGHVDRHYAITVDFEANRTLQQRY
jgi:hypothetical protein